MGEDVFGAKTFLIGDAAWEECRKLQWYPGYDVGSLGPVEASLLYFGPFKAKRSTSIVYLPTLLACCCGPETNPLRALASVICTAAWLFSILLSSFPQAYSKSTHIILHSELFTSLFCAWLAIMQMPDLHRSLRSSTVRHLLPQGRHPFPSDSMLFRHPLLWSLTRWRRLAKSSFLSSPVIFCARWPRSPLSPALF